MSRPAPRWQPGALIRVSVPGGPVYGLVVRAGVVVEAAPIARRWLGVDERVVARALRARGATFERLGHDDAHESR